MAIKLITLILVTNACTVLVFQTFIMRFLAQISLLLCVIIYACRTNMLVRLQGDLHQDYAVTYRFVFE